MRKHVLQWHILHKCNLRCSHCYQEEYNKELNLEQLKGILYSYIDFCKKKKYKGHINFTGGEPFLSPHLFDLLQECDKNGITFGILTNGTLLNADIINKLKNLCGLNFIQVSIDGLKNTHDNIRGEGNFDKAFNGLELLKKAEIQTMVAFTVHKGNVNELSSVIKYVRKKKIDRFWVDRLIPMGSNTEDILSTEEYKKVIRLLTKEHYRKSIFNRTDVHLNRALQFLEGGDCFYRCSAGDSLLTVLADGTLLPCRRLPLEIGNCLETDIVSLYDNSAIIADLLKNTIPDDCSTCPKSIYCGGGAKCLTYALTGDYHGKDHNCYMIY